MRKRDDFDVSLSMLAALMDAVAVFAGFMLATWLRFDSGLVRIVYGRPSDLYPVYTLGAAFATVVFLLVYRYMGLFVRPQIGSFISKIPRIVRASFIGIVLVMVAAFAVKNEVDYARGVIGIGFVTTTVAVLLERWILFRTEWNLARHTQSRNHVLIIGTDSVAAHLKRTLERESMLRAKIVGFLRTDAAQPDAGVPSDQVIGGLDMLADFVAANRVDQIILASSDLGHKRMVEIIVLCEKNLITFNMVPDLFRVMTSDMDVQSLDDIPLLGIRAWPLDHFWNRFLKRSEDIAGAAIGLVIASPVIALAALAVKGTSPGPAFFAQERCGERGRTFRLFKLRTMREGAEQETGPVFTVENDPRTTPVGGFLRRWNLDELPQLWNVLRGDMSLVGPRPERPHFVEQFKEEVGGYMWRHVSRPGLTGWAQVNGLRGNTSIEERVKYDLYYLENWSLAFDFKILMRTLFARKNAY